MLCSLRYFLLSCVLFIFFFSKDIIPNTGHKKQNKEILFEAYKTPSANFIGFFVEEGLAVIELIEKIDEKVQNGLGVLCSGCQKKILSCAELAGSLCADEDRDNLNVLKQLLKKKDAQKINSFLLAIAHEKVIACAFCEKYIGWVYRNS